MNLFALRAERAFEAAEQMSDRQPTNVTNSIHLARAAFDWADFARTSDDRATIAARGIEAARSAIQRVSTNAAAHYWLGMNLGQLARTKTLGALKLIREMEEEFLRARSLDSHTDFAGPDRSLGYLYRDAPGWPASIGNKKKAREHLDRAVELHPEFPDNQLALVESFAEWNESQNFARQLKSAEAVIAQALDKFYGEAWESSWADWNKRLALLKSKDRETNRPITSKGER